jgi:hypothetical protein
MEHRDTLNPVYYNSVQYCIVYYLICVVTVISCTCIISLRRCACVLLSGFGYRSANIIYPNSQYEDTTLSV